MTDAVCPVCGGSGLVPAETEPQRSDQTFSSRAPVRGQSDRVQIARDRDQTTSDRDQTASDRDQTWSDHDQTASDRDQRSAHEDQEAADADFDAGGDPLVHNRSAAARIRAHRDREAVAHERDATADERLETAAQRDLSSEIRERAGEDRDRAAPHEERSAPDLPEADMLLRAGRDRAIAAADRARAADDRAQAAADREEATRQREEAFLIQAEARQEFLAAATDELTGAYTRKFGLENIIREIERARRTDDSLTLAFIDVDGLKEVNDNEGHQHGDRLLRHVVETLRAHVRAYDVIVRYGGDEFLCALPHLNGTVARERLETISALLTGEDAHHSIAFGLAEYDPPEEVDSLIDRADAELIEAKRVHKRHG